LVDTITKRLAEVALSRDFGGYEARRIESPHVKKKN
jgi:hypothetical protein